MISPKDHNFIWENSWPVLESYSLAGALSSNWTTAFGKIIMILWIMIGTGVVLTGLGITTYLLKSKQESKNIDK